MVRWSDLFWSVCDISHLWGSLWPLLGHWSLHVEILFFGEHWFLWLLGSELPEYLVFCSAEKGVVFGSPLTEEGIAQVSQLIEYLHKSKWLWLLSSYPNGCLSGPPQVCSGDSDKLWVLQQQEFETALGNCSPELPSIYVDLFPFVQELSLLMGDSLKSCLWMQFTEVCCQALERWGNCFSKKVGNQPLIIQCSFFSPLCWADLRAEGLFRVPGNSIRQQILKDALNSGTDIDLDSGEFHSNDVATLLKMFLGELPEPLLTHKHFHAHLKIAGEWAARGSDGQKDWNWPSRKHTRLWCVFLKGSIRRNLPATSAWWWKD